LFKAIYDSSCAYENLHSLLMFNRLVQQPG
jgi:hypothetical protein